MLERLLRSEEASSPVLPCARCRLSATAASQNEHIIHCDVFPGHSGRNREVVVSFIFLFNLNVMLKLGLFTASAHCVKYQHRNDEIYQDPPVLRRRLRTASGLLRNDAEQL
jgi:hypothetical protein